MHHAFRTTFASATLLALVAATSPAWAQATGNAARGKLLFDDTAGTSGISTLTSSCAGCHQTVQNRRIAVGGSATAQIDPETAYTDLVKAITSVNQMTQFKALEPEDVQDLAAFIADTPHVDKATLTFTSTGVNTAAAAQSVTLQSPKAPFAPLVVRSVAVAGNGAGNFNHTFTCVKTYATGEACTFTVTYDPRDTVNSNPVLTITMRDGANGTDYNRRVQLQGSIAGTTPTNPTNPTTPTAPAEDSGGGAAGHGLLALLAAACGVLGLRRRRA